MTAPTPSLRTKSAIQRGDRVAVIPRGSGNPQDWGCPAVTLGPYSIKDTFAKPTVIPRGSGNPQGGGRDRHSGLDAESTRWGTNMGRDDALHRFHPRIPVSSTGTGL